MSAIWHQDSEGWRLLSTTGFPDEATLHELIEQAPHLMPLAGSPDLIMLGREVLLGGNYADLIAIEPAGRLVIIEIKLARNAEARRAVIAQILTYAAYLHGLEVTVLERDILGPHLARRGYADLSVALRDHDQTSSFDESMFRRQLAECLRDGWFRLVLVLDEAPAPLVQLVSYLEAVTDNLIIDLITVSSYEVGGSRIVVPQRISGESTSAPHHLLGDSPSAATTEKVASAPSQEVIGGDHFVAAIAAAPIGQQEQLQRLARWAISLEQAGIAQLRTTVGRQILTLRPLVPAHGAGLVTIWNDRGNGYVQFWRSVIANTAPTCLARIEAAVTPARVAQGTTTKDISDELLNALTAAYQEAAAGRITVTADE